MSPDNGLCLTEHRTSGHVPLEQNYLKLIIVLQYICQDRDDVDKLLERDT